jgi:hypothetical protein
MTTIATSPRLLTDEATYNPIQQAVFDRAVSLSAKRAARAQAEWSFYTMGQGTAPGEYWLKSPNMDECLFPRHAVNILTGKCDCKDADTHIKRINDELEAVGLPPSVCCAHPAIVLEKLANGWTPESEEEEEEEATLETVAEARARVETAAREFDALSREKRLHLRTHPGDTEAAVCEASRRAGSELAAAKRLYAEAQKRQESEALPVAAAGVGSGRSVVMSGRDFD